MAPLTRVTLPRHSLASITSTTSSSSSSSMTHPLSPSVLLPPSSPAAAAAYPPQSSITNKRGNRLYADAIHAATRALNDAGIGGVALFGSAWLSFAGSDDYPDNVDLLARAEGTDEIVAALVEGERGGVSAEGVPFFYGFAAVEPEDDADEEEEEEDKENMDDDTYDQVLPRPACAEFLFTYHALPSPAHPIVSKSLRLKIFPYHHRSFDPLPTLRAAQSNLFGVAVPIPFAHVLPVFSGMAIQAGTTHRGPGHRCLDLRWLALMYGAALRECCGEGDVWAVVVARRKFGKVLDGVVRAIGVDVEGVKGGEGRVVTAEMWAAKVRKEVFGDEMAGLGMSGL